MSLPDSRITICLHRGTGAISRLIRWQTRSEYSHASMILGSGLFIEAREFIGVRALQSLTAPAGEEVDLFHVEMSATQMEEAADFALAQLGKPYDYTMVARFVSRRDASRASSGKWFCSELVYASLQVAGVSLLRDTQPWEVSPGLLARSPLLRPYRLNVVPHPLAA